jgi:hypothetical protein
MADRALVTLGTFAALLTFIALLSAILTILNVPSANIEGMGQSLTIVYAYQKTCPHCKPKEVESLVTGMQQAAKACDITLDLELVEVREQPDKAASLEVDVTPTAFTKVNGTTARMDDGSVGGIRAFLEKQFAECKK